MLAEWEQKKVVIELGQKRCFFERNRGRWLCGNREIVICARAEEDVP
jgi:hypothetical protein